MITLFTGMPGAGKTAAMLALLMEELRDRPLFVHYDPAEKTRPDQKLLHETLTLPHQVINANEWHTHLPDGAVLVIDEVQGCWRPRGPASKVPDCIKALETHRHAGADIFLTTQAPRLMDANVRGLVGRHVHIRDTGFLGRWWYEWPECNEGISWKTCPVKKRYRLPKKVFGVYQSSVQHNKSIRTIPPLAYLALGLIVATVVGVVMTVRIIGKHANEAPAALPDAPKPGLVHVPPSSAVVASGVKLAPDERVDFMPRLSDRPWTAPAYDDLRKVVSMPTITGSICVNGRCVCYHGKGRLLDVESDACAVWTRDRPFDPYASDPTAVAFDSASAGTGRASMPAAAPASVTGSPAPSVGAAVPGAPAAL